MRHHCQGAGFTGRWNRCDRWLLIGGQEWGRLWGGGWGAGRQPNGQKQQDGEKSLHGYLSFESVFADVNTQQQTPLQADSGSLSEHLVAKAAGAVGKQGGLIERVSQPVGADAFDRISPGDQGNCVTCLAMNGGRI